MIKFTTLDKYIVRQFIPVFFMALTMFAFVLILIDLFANLIRYLNNEVPILTILKISLYYTPKCVSYSLPLSLLFAAAYTLGDLYAKNELTIVFSSGIPFWRVSIPLIIIGLTASFFSFFLDDIFVIPTLKIKNELSRTALHYQVLVSNSDIVIKANNGNLIYSIDYFDYEHLSINGISIIEINDSGEFISQVKALSAEWKEDHWELRSPYIYQFEDGMLKVRPLGPSTSYDVHPSILRRNSFIIEELPAREARLLVEDLRAAGLPYSTVLANYYHRFSFSAASLIVMILSVSMGGRFRKNILLMSLFTSLAVAVVYYVTEMLSMTMAGLGIIHPASGAWFPVLLFLFAGTLLIRSAKT